MASAQINNDINVEMKNMVMCFRVTELAVLLGFAGKSKSGRKSDLVTRALHLMKSSQCTRSIQAKVVELYSRRFPRHAMQIRQQYSTLLEQELSQLEKRNMNDANVTPVQPNAAPLHRVSPDAPLLKVLSFYEHISVILPTMKLVAAANNSRVMRTQEFKFRISPQQVQKISSGTTRDSNNKTRYEIQVQLRFCVWDRAKVQDDDLPPDLVVFVNRSPVSLPPFTVPTNCGVVPKRVNRPLDITTLCRLSGTGYNDNKLEVRWNEVSKPSWTKQSYAIAINLVQHLSVDDLMRKLSQTKPMASSVSTYLVKNKLAKDPESDISTTSLKVSLSCPIGKVRLKIPVRPLRCDHLQCFDANLFLMMNEKKPTWICPVCDKSAEFADLRIDELFVNILEETKSDEVEFIEDGTWRSARKRTETVVLGTPVKPIDLSKSTTYISDDDVDPKEVVDVIDLTCESSSDDEKRTKDRIPDGTHMVIGSPIIEPEKIIIPKVEMPFDHHHSYGKSRKTTNRSHSSSSVSPYPKSNSPGLSQSSKTPTYDLTRKTPPPRHLRQSSITAHFSRQPARKKLHISKNPCSDSQSSTGKSFQDTVSENLSSNIIEISPTLSDDGRPSSGNVFDTSISAVQTSCPLADVDKTLPRSNVTHALSIPLSRISEAVSDNNMSHSRSVVEFSPTRIDESFSGLDGPDSNAVANSAILQPNIRGTTPDLDRPASMTRTPPPRISRTPPNVHRPFPSLLPGPSSISRQVGPLNQPLFPTVYPLSPTFDYSLFPSFSVQNAYLPPQLPRSFPGSPQRLQPRSRPDPRTPTSANEQINRFDITDFSVTNIFGDALPLD